MGERAVHPWWGRLLLLAFGILDIAAVVWTATHLRPAVAGNAVVNFFSYFTIQSNLLAIAVLLIVALRDPQGIGWQRVRGAGTLYICITGVVYTVLLQNIDVDIAYPWTNNVLHRITPLVLFVDWLLVPVALGVSARLISIWLTYPIAYGVYTLIRGPIADWYPYPFIDPRTQGYLSMAIGLVVLVIAFVILAVAVIALGELAARWRERRQAA
ncbi:Pr6Pr family membrane protein [Nocardia yamanashiensis]|uniref:Pr6Pr family membrane protein n=1 Tax=Nocardia yamanashiensis TaxID=209247 RepID=UPI001E42C67B|nr:Pr6Pr family membrane protein [Nocardia yamanashiensis]UGT42481.1 Pr6Pr family membrane protein [Nocardia yamanashiensis]